MMRRLLLMSLSLALAALPIVAAPPAHADDPPLGNSGSASGDGKNYEATTTSRIQMSGSGYQQGGSQTTRVWNGPPCWFEPRFTYEEMLAYVQQNHSIMQNTGGGEEAAAAQWRNVTLDEIKQYEGQQGKIFWFLVSNGSQEGDECLANADRFWIYNESSVVDPNDQLLDIIDLVRMARANLTVPEPEIQINPPGGRSYVGLETWVGVAEQQELQVTAGIPDVPGLSVTLTARPTKVTIKADTDQVEVQDSEDGLEKCPPYQKGADPKDGCWIIFEKASLDSPYTITVTQIWEVTANVQVPEQDANGDPILPPGEGTATAEIEIDEIQSTVVRGGNG